ncbi:MAG: caspase family protein [Prevotellaceae bacterium]|nr:caspase family protein [Candidatus Faecinaster equi]
MKKILFILSMMVAYSLSMQATTKRALIIGIGDYPEESGWGKINGDKDIPIVEDMLIANGFERQHIVALANAQATKNGIQTAMMSLTTSAQQNDVVYIHFSGHGQQVADENGDEDDGMDEAWIPFDARAIYIEGQYEGENHILDDELYGWFSGIKDKIGDNGQLIVVADACHSGGGSRGTEDDTICIRGNFSMEWVERQMARLTEIVDQNNVLKQISTQIFSRPTSATSHPQTRVQYGPIRWIFISACKGYQTNQEYRGSGSLTTALSVLKERITQLTYEDLRLSIKQWMNQHLPKTQSPTIDFPHDETGSALFHSN